MSGGGGALRKKFRLALGYVRECVNKKVMRLLSSLPCLCARALARVKLYILIMRFNSLLFIFTCLREAFNRKIKLNFLLASNDT